MPQIEFWVGPEHFADDLGWSPFFRWPAGKYFMTSAVRSGLNVYEVRSGDPDGVSEVELCLATPRKRRAGDPIDYRVYARVPFRFTIERCSGGELIDTETAQRYTVPHVFAAGKHRFQARAVAPKTTKPTTARG